jgi:hypothetical protein
MWHVGAAMFYLGSLLFMSTVEEPCAHLKIKIVHGYPVAREMDRLMYELPNLTGKCKNRYSRKKKTLQQISS